MHDILFFESGLRTLDTSNVELCFFPVLLLNNAIFLKSCMADVVEKGQSSNGVGKFLFAVYLENTLFKDKFLHPFFRTDWIGNMPTYGRLRSKLTISILLLVKFFRVFLSPKQWHNSHARQPCCMQFFAARLCRVP